MKLIFSNLAVKENKGYFADNFCQILFQVDFLTGEISALSKLTELYTAVGHLYCNIEIWNDKLILIPNSARTILVYDLAANEKNETFIEHKNKLQLYSNFNYGEMGYFFNVWDQYIHQLNYATGEMNVIDVFGQKDSAKADRTYFWNQFYAQNENVAYLLVNQSSTVVKLDLKTKKSEAYNVFGINEAFYDICFWDNHLWLSTCNGEIIQWNCEKGMIYKFSLPDSEECYEKRLCRLAVINNHIAVLGVYRDGTVITINPNSHEIDRKNMQGLLFEYDRTNEKWTDNFLNVEIRGSEVILIYKNGSFYISKDLCGKMHDVLEVDERKYIDFRNFYRYEHQGIMLETFLQLKFFQNVDAQKSDFGADIFEKCFL